MKVAPGPRVVGVAHRLGDEGCDEVSIGDTIGVAVPTRVAHLATEDLLYMLHGMGIETEVTLAAVAGPPVARKAAP